MNPEAWASSMTALGSAIVSVRGRQPAQALPCVYEVPTFCGFTEGREARAPEDSDERRLRRPEEQGLRLRLAGMAKARRAGHR